MQKKEQKKNRKIVRNVRVTKCIILSLVCTSSHSKRHEAKPSTRAAAKTIVSERKQTFDVIGTGKQHILEVMALQGMNQEL